MDAQQHQEYLHFAVIEENLDVVKFILKHDAVVDRRIEKKDLFVVFPSDSEHRAYLASFFDTQNQKEIDEQVNEMVESKTVTPLHLAARQKRCPIAESLIEYGAQVDATMSGGETPLMIAIMHKRANLAALLIRKLARVNAKTIWGKSALHYAAQNGQEATVQLLLDYGADIDAITREGLTPLHVAAEAGYKNIVVALLERGADVKKRASNGASVIDYAAMMGHPRVVELLFKHWGDIGTFEPHEDMNLSLYTWAPLSSDDETERQLVSRVGEAKRLRR